MTPTFTLGSYGTRTCHSTADRTSGRWVVMVRSFAGFTGQVARETSHGSFVEVGNGGLDISSLSSLDVAFHDGRPTLAVNAQVLRLNYVGSFP